MGRNSLALVWAVAILASALVANGVELGDNASFALTAGLSGAAWASIQADTPCGRGCLQ